MDFRYEFSESAKVDLLDILRYFNDDLDLPQTAERFNRKVYEKIVRICENPYLYPIHHNEKLDSLGVRFVAVEKYLILYVANDYTKNVSILRIVHGRRNLDGIILG
jgi:toxin ParE1/3/4